MKNDEAVGSRHTSSLPYKTPAMDTQHKPTHSFLADPPEMVSLRTDPIVICPTHLGRSPVRRLVGRLAERLAGRSAGRPPSRPDVMP